VRPSDPSGPETRKFSYPDTLLTDSASGLLGKDVLSIRFTPGSTAIVEVNLPKPLGGDSIRLSLWTLGVRTTQLTLVASSGVSMKISGTVQRGNFERNLLSLLRRRVTIDSTLKFDRASLTKLYARELVDAKDTSLTGFPGRRPTGIDSTEVVRAAMVYLTSKRAAFSSLVGKTWLGIDSAVVHVQLVELAKAGVITSQDSLRLFPLPPVRIKSAIAFAVDSMVVGGSKVPVTGVFEADTLRGVSYLDVRMLGSDSSVRTEWFDVNQPSSPQGLPTWNLAQKLSIGASASAKPGTYTLVMVARAGDRKDSAVARTGIRVVAAPAVVVDPPPVAKDEIGPVLELVEPSKVLLSVDSSVSSYTIKVKATDSSGVEKVTIQDTAASFKDGVWSRTVQVALYGTNEFLIKATDKKGNSTSQTVFLNRKPPANFGSAPKVVFLGASDRISLPFEQKSIVLSWLVTDSVGIASVSVDSRILTSKSDTFSVNYPVDATGDTVVVHLLATNKLPLGVQSSVFLFRGRDTTRPTVAIDSASWTQIGAFRNDTFEIPLATTSLDLGWKITDNGALKSVLVADDTLKLGGDGLHRWKLSSLPTGLSKFTLLATDSAGNLQSVVVKLLRREQALVNATDDKAVLIDSGVVTASSPTPGATVEYSTDGSTWTVVPEAGILLTESKTITFRARREGYTDAVLVRLYVVKITPPADATGAVWNEFDWNDALRVWQ
jgi:hypothetical protein